MRTLADNVQSRSTELEEYYDINSLLQGDKKIVTFMGSRRSGATSILNNVAKALSTKGVNVAILDTTQNKDTYYIYTKNQENLRKQASVSIEGLMHGETKGIKVNNNLTVYTDLPGDNKYLQNVEQILETLLKNYSLILIDCDFSTPINYFQYAVEIFLVQTMNTLSIQPLTQRLLELKNRGILQDSKLRIIINKYVDIKGISEREIISAMSYYNDPSMTYMKELFNRNTVPYMIIPFEKDTYEKYLSDVANCNITLEGNSYNYIQKLNELMNEIVPRN